MRPLEFGWYLPTHGDTTAYGVASAQIAGSAELCERVVHAAERPVMQHRAFAATALVLLAASAGCTWPWDVLRHGTGDATTGDYMFPAVVPHRVAIKPGEIASFMIGYGDNPFGPTANEPYDVACPPADAVRVTLPGTSEFGTAHVAIGACGGGVRVSPIVPGANGLRFQ